jgi:small subunit ribosomal protein S20
MPIIKSAKKRVKVSYKATVRNAKTKRNLKESVKSFKEAAKSGKKIDETLKKAISAIDVAVKKNVIHKNKAAHKKSQLSKIAKEAGHKPAKKTAKNTASKPAAKKPVTKKPAVKK